MTEVRGLSDRVREYPDQSIEEYLTRHPHLGEGNLTGAELLVRRDAIGIVFDEFGFDPDVRDEGDDRCRVTIKHVVAEDLLKFALTHADAVEVEKPESVRATLRRTAHQMQEKYLKTPRDKFLAECEHIRACTEEGNDPKNLRLSVRGLDLRRATEHLGLDVGCATFIKSQIDKSDFLASYSSLHTLRLDGNGFSDFSALSNCKLLSDLEIRNATIRSLDFLKGCESLRNLALIDCTVEDARALYEERYLDEIVLSHCSGIDVDLMKRRQQAIPTDYFIDKGFGNAVHWPAFPINKQYSEYPYPLNMADEFLSVARTCNVPETEKRELYKKLALSSEVVDAAEEMVLDLSARERRILKELFGKGESLREAAISLGITVADVLDAYQSGRQRMLYRHSAFGKMVRSALVKIEPNCSIAGAKKN